MLRTVIPTIRVTFQVNATGKKCRPPKLCGSKTLAATLVHILTLQNWKHRDLRSATGFADRYIPLRLQERCAGTSIATLRKPRITVDMGIELPHNVMLGPQALHSRPWKYTKGRAKVQIYQSCHIPVTNLSLIQKNDEQLTKKPHLPLVGNVTKVSLATALQPSFQNRVYVHVLHLHYVRRFQALDRYLLRVHTSPPHREQFSQIYLLIHAEGFSYFFCSSKEPTLLKENRIRILRRRRDKTELRSINGDLQWTFTDVVKALSN